MGLFEKVFGTYSQRELKRVTPIADRVLALEEQYKKLTDAELRGMTAKLKARLEQGETLDDILPDAFATCREAGDRVLGMRHFPVQIIGGIVLHQGRIAEMKTGEGKTLVATLPAYLNALTGRGVHIVTVNDYLAKRDSEWMGKLYRYLGLSVGLIIHGMNKEEKRAAYNADITYCTNNELGFDYLRDNMVVRKEELVQRKFYYAIVDEVDSILIDEARTPLIISGPGEKSTDMYAIADRFARTLTCTRIKETDNKSLNEDIEGDYIVDEKAKTATLTPSGVKKAEQFFQLDNLMDGKNITIQHHINQAIRAHGIMHRDIDYVVKDGEIVIVDEFTGRMMQGRRYNEGLHQAIEAKEGVKVNRESKTLATITFQNFFRMYEKLSGMTGTAATEADEFQEIYKMDVIEIPTNRPIARIDRPDSIYKTERGKFNAVIEKIVECHGKKQPVLVGTISIEKSELLSGMLKKRGIPHVVLNAKYHDKEAEIVAQAGKLGAVTIATNMAGRGTDIMLGGNAEFLAKNQLRKEGMDEALIVEADGHGDTDDEAILEARRRFEEYHKKFKEAISGEAEEVRRLGGLMILGTERHESRRIDNQLRGRAGRQGDPGETRFYLSMEDDLMRLFGGERMQNMMDSLGVEEDMPIENRMLTNTVESAQKKLEARNFSIRRNVLRYDDVMNTQREVIYGQRSMVLNGEDISGVIQNMIGEVIDSSVKTFLADEEVHDDWNIAGLRDYFLGWITVQGDLNYTREQLAEVSRDDIQQQLLDRAHTLYQRKEEEIGSELMRELERVVLLRTVDLKWMDHIDAMDELKRGISLRSYAQRDPVLDYRKEGYEMFEQMIASIQEDTVKLLFTLQVKREAMPEREQVAKPTSESGPSDGSLANQPRAAKKPGRNDPCPCGSGKKYKKCCGQNE